MLWLWIKRSVLISCFIPNVKAFTNMQYDFLHDDISAHKRRLHIELFCLYGYPLKKSSNESVMLCFSRVAAHVPISHFLLEDLCSVLLIWICYSGNTERDVFVDQRKLEVLIIPSFQWIQGAKFYGCLPRPDCISQNHYSVCRNTFLVWVQEYGN